MDIEKWRQEVDTVDAQLVALLEARMALVARIGREKAKTGAATRDLERERALLAQVRAGVVQEEFAETIVASFEDILKHSREYQDKKRQE